MHHNSTFLVSSNIVAFLCMCSYLNIMFHCNIKNMVIVLQNWLQLLKSVLNCTDLCGILGIQAFFYGQLERRLCCAIQYLQLYLHWCCGVSFQSGYRILLKEPYFFLYILGSPIFRMCPVNVNIHIRVKYIILCASATVFIVIPSLKSRYEEFFLRQFFGSQYEEYARKVHSGLPFIN